MTAASATDHRASVARTIVFAILATLALCGAAPAEDRPSIITSSSGRGG